MSSTNTGKMRPKEMAEVYGPQVVKLLRDQRHIASHNAQLPRILSYFPETQRPAKVPSLRIDDTLTTSECSLLSRDALDEIYEAESVFAQNLIGQKVGNWEDMTDVGDEDKISVQRLQRSESDLIKVYKEALKTTSQKENASIIASKLAHNFGKAVMKTFYYILKTPVKKVDNLITLSISPKTEFNAVLDEVTTRMKAKNHTAIYEEIKSTVKTRIGFITPDQMNTLAAGRMTCLTALTDAMLQNGGRIANLSNNLVGKVIAQLTKVYDKELMHAKVNPAAERYKYSEQLAGNFARSTLLCINSVLDEGPIGTEACERFIS